MTKLLTGLAVGAAMFLGLGAAQAEPLKLTGPQMDAVTAGGFFNFNFADAQAKAKAFGGVSFAVTDTKAFAAPGIAASRSSSSACSGLVCGIL